MYKRQGNTLVFCIIRKVCRIISELILFIKILISTIFLFSFISKIFTFTKFLNVFSSLGFNKYFSFIAAILILSLEALVSLLIIFKKTSFYGEVILFFLILSFFITAIYSQIKRLQISCNCFGELSDEKLGKSTYPRIVFLFILLNLLFFSKIEVGITTYSFEKNFMLCFASINIMILYYLSKNFKKLTTLRRIPKS
ncbi:MauE/DoxX family redox-associated membrane protein [Lysinibacillus sp. 2017]|uniref:MauE/DoxX family redox-associated membrane protein n=1 Tax=unclassified Lysinibacillus TaxID=2636778 RepID=UPI0026840BF4